jgi:hypothetical protein
MVDPSKSRRLILARADGRSQHMQRLQVCWLGFQDRVPAYILAAEL